MERYMLYTWPESQDVMDNEDAIPVYSVGDEVEQNILLPDENGDYKQSDDWQTLHPDRLTDDEGNAYIPVD